MFQMNLHPQSRRQSQQLTAKHWQFSTESHGITFQITWHHIPEDNILQIQELQKFVTMKLHRNDNGGQYVINLSSRRNSILTHYCVLSGKKMEKK